MPYKKKLIHSGNIMILHTQEEANETLKFAKKFLDPLLEEYISTIKEKYIPILGQYDKFLEVSSEEDLYPVWSAEGNDSLGISVKLSLYTKEQYEKEKKHSSWTNPSVLSVTILEEFRLEITDCLTDIPTVFKNFWDGLVKGMNEGDDFIIIGEEEITFKAKIVTPYGVLGAQEEYGDTWWAWDSIVGVV